MTTISLVATDQLLSVALQPKVASGDQNSVELHVDFDSEWDGYGKSAVFFTSDNRTVYEIPLTDGSCMIPHEVLAKSGTLYIGIRGVNADNAVKTSSLVKYKIAEGAPSGNGTTVEPTADVYQQLLSAYGKTDTAVSVERARIDNMIAMRDTNGAVIVEDRANQYDYSITTNGATAQVEIMFGEVELSPGFHAEDIDFPAKFAPMTTVILKDASTGACFEIRPAEPGAEYAKTILSYDHDETFTPQTIEFYGEYALASVSVEELADLRVGIDGTAYPTAGAAVRDMVGRVLTQQGKPDSDAYYSVGRLYMDTDTGILYQCTANDEEAGTSTWEIVHGSVVTFTFNDNGMVADISVSANEIFNRVEAGEYDIILIGTVDNEQRVYRLVSKGESTLHGNCCYFSYVSGAYTDTIIIPQNGIISRGQGNITAGCASAEDVETLEKLVVRKADNLYKGEIKEGGYYGNDGTWTENANYKMAILPVGAVKNLDVLTFSQEFSYYGTSYHFDVFRADGTHLRYHDITNYDTIQINVSDYDVGEDFYVAMRIKTTQDHTKLVVVNDGILEDIQLMQVLSEEVKSLESQIVRKANNLYQGEVKEGGYYGTSGAWTESSTYKMAILPVGAVKNLDVLTFSSEFPYYGTQYMFSVFKADGTFLRYHSISQYGTIQINVSDYDVDDDFYVAMRIKATQDHTKLVIVNDGILEDMTHCDHLGKITNPLKGKVFNCLGDSFTAPSQSWAYHLAIRTGCVCNNYGVASSRVSVDSPSGILSFLNRYAAMDANADATIIFGGINDAGAIVATDVTLGDMDSALDTTTFYGALKLLITNIKAYMPGKKIIGVIPPDFIPDSNYRFLPDVQQACREVYTSFAIPYIDLKNECQEMYEDDYNNATYRRASSNDYHPSVLGQIAISEVIQGGLEKYIKV